MPTTSTHSRTGLDRFWANQECIYATLTKTDNRSFVDMDNISIFQFHHFSNAHLMGIEALAFTLLSALFALILSNAFG